MRLTEFWRRMEVCFGPAADTVSRDSVLAELGHRTAREALADGVAVKEVWRGVWLGMGLPEEHR